MSPNRFKAVSKVWIGSPKHALMVVLWDKSQSALSPFSSTFSHAQRPLGLHLNPLSPIWLAFAGLELHSYVCVTVHTTCLLSLPTSCWDAGIHFWNISLVLDVNNSIYISMKDFSQFVKEGVSINYANIFHRRKNISPRGKFFWNMLLMNIH